METHVSGALTWWGDLRVPVGGLVLLSLWEHPPSDQVDDLLVPSETNPTKEVEFTGRNPDGSPVTPHASSRPFLLLPPPKNFWI